MGAAGKTSLEPPLHLPLWATNTSGTSTAAAGDGKGFRGPGDRGAPLLDPDGGRERLDRQVRSLSTVPLLGLHQEAQPVTAGGAVIGGLEIGLSGPAYVGIEVLAGYNDGVVAQGGLGVGLRL